MVTIQSGVAASALALCVCCVLSACEPRRVPRLPTLLELLSLLARAVWPGGVDVIWFAYLIREFGFFVCLLGVFAWCVCLVCLLGVFAWRVCLACLLGVLAWCVCLVYHVDVDRTQTRTWSAICLC